MWIGSLCVSVCLCICFFFLIQSQSVSLYLSVYPLSLSVLPKWSTSVLNLQPMLILTLFMFFAIGKGIALSHCISALCFMHTAQCNGVQNVTSSNHALNNACFFAYWWSILNSSLSRKLTCFCHFNKLLLQAVVSGF